jgi:hypothetical protein
MLTPADSMEDASSSMLVVEPDELGVDVELQDLVDKGEIQDLVDQDHGLSMVSFRILSMLPNCLKIITRMILSTTRLAHATSTRL